MRFQTFVLALVATFASQIVPAATLSIPIGHLDDAGLSDNYTKKVTLKCSGPMRISGNHPVMASLTATSDPGITYEDSGLQYIKVSTHNIFEAEGESVKEVDITLIDPATLTPKVGINAAGHRTLYSLSNRYPRTLKVGTRILLATSQTFDPQSPATPLHSTRTKLSLEPTKGDSNLFELCETASQVKPGDSPNKPSSKTSSCLLIDQNGKVKHYKLLIIDGDMRTTLLGGLSSE